MKKPWRYHGECCASGGPAAKTFRKSLGGVSIITACIVQSSMYCAYWYILCTAHCVLCTLVCIVHIGMYCTHWYVLCITVCIVHCSVYCALHSVGYLLFSANCEQQCIVHHTANCTPKCILHRLYCRHPVPGEWSVECCHPL